MPGPSTSSGIDTVALAAEIKLRWRAGETPDTEAVLSQHADLDWNRSTAIDLAYEEYCLRLDAGQTPEIDRFCQRFPEISTSLRKVIDAHHLLDEHPELLEGPPVQWPSVNDTFDGLRIIGELGRGAFGRAYLAFDPETDRRCVLKLSTRPSLEARYLGQATHPHISDVYWARTIEGFSAVCLPFLGRTTLEHLLDLRASAKDPRPWTGAQFLDGIEPTGSLDIPDHRPILIQQSDSWLVVVAALVAPLARALAHLHARGIHHGDLKPSNIILAEDGHPYLIDFNLAGSVAGPVLGGTLAYMAPEQIRTLLNPKHNEGVHGPSTDLFGLGVLLHQLLTGKIPGPDATTVPDRLAYWLLQPTFDVPSPFHELIAGCLHLNPKKRPAADRIAQCLERIRDQGRHRRGWKRPLTAAVSITALSLLGAAVWQAQTPPSVEAVEAKKEPPVNDTPLARGILALQAKQFPVAISELSEAYRERPDATNAAHLGYVLAASGQAHSASTALEEAIRLGDDDPATRNNLAVSYMKQNQWNKAVAVLEPLVAKGDASDIVRMNMAMARFGRDGGLVQQLKSTQCIDDLTAVLHSQPDSAEAHYQMARFLTGANRDPSQVVEHLLHAIRLGKDPRFIRYEPFFNSLLRDHAQLRSVVDSTPVDTNSSPIMPTELVMPRTPIDR